MASNKWGCKYDNFQYIIVRSLQTTCSSDFFCDFFTYRISCFLELLNIFQQTQLSNLKMALGSMSTNILVVWGSSKIHSTLNFLCLPLMQEKCQQWTRQLVVKRRQLKQEKRQPQGQTIFSRKATGSDSWVFFPIFSIGNFILWFDLIMWKESGRFFFF